MSTIAQRLAHIRAQVAAACHQANRDPDSVTLIAVSKHQPIAAIAEAYAAGQRDFGENYVQEWRDKMAALPEDIRWHFIGHLQSNKAPIIAESALFALHTVDSASLANRISRRRPLDAPPLPIFIEVNLGQESTKAGVAIDHCRDLVAKVDKTQRLRVLGLMAIPPYDPTPEHSRHHFRQLAALQAEINLARPPERRLHHLSMGMSDDFPIAIAEGATMIRVGTAIFGPRQAP